MENDQSNLPMETFIHSVASSLTLSTIAYCEKFDANNNFLVIGNGSNLNFFQFNLDTPIFKFSYQLFGDIALLIPYKCDSIMLLIVILSSSKFCVLHYENEKIVCDQNGELSASVGTDIGQKYSYSLYKSLLLIQIWQEGLQLYFIKKNQLIFVQDFSFFSSIIYRFQLISSNQFVVLQSKFGLLNSYEIYNFDIISQELSQQHNVPQDFNNFLRLKKNDFLISKKKMIEIKDKKYQTVMEFNLDEDIYDIIQLSNNNLYFVVTISGEILLIEQQNDSKSKINRIGKVNKPLKLVIINKNNIIIPCKSGETMYFKFNGTQYILKSLFVSTGKVIKFISISKRLFLGLTRTNHAYRIEKTIILDDLYDYKFDSRNHCWFIDDSNILFSNENSTKILNFLNQTENFDFYIERSDETIGFQMYNENNYIQITKRCVFINNEPLSFTFSNISLPYFSESSFSFCSDSFDVFVLYFDGEIIFNHEFSFKINSLALYKDEKLAISSWESDSVLVIDLKKSNEDRIELIHEFKNLCAIDLLFTNEGESICALLPKDEVHFLNLSNLSIKKIQCEGNFYKLTEISENEILVSGEIPYLIEDQVITEVYDVGSFLFADSFNDLLLFCKFDNSLSIKKRQKNYQFQSKTLQIPFKLINIVEFDQNLTSVIIKNDKNVINIALTSNVLDFKNYKIYSLDFIPNNNKFISLITVIDIISKTPFIVILIDTEILSLSYINSNQFVKKSSFKFDSKPIGLTNIENNIFCLILIDKFFIFSLEEGIIIKLFTLNTLGASSSFAYLNKKLIIGDLIESLIIYEYDDSNITFKEVFRESHELSCSSCTFVDDESIFCGDFNSYLYLVNLSQEKNYASNDLKIMSVCSLGSSAKTIFYCMELNCILIGTSNGEIIECKEAETPEIFQSFYTSIEKSISSLGGFECAQFRKCICMGYFLGIPRIYDVDLLKTFLELNEEQKRKIIEKNGLDLSVDDADFICKQILDSM